jgi:hypothetical protein
LKNAKFENGYISSDSIQSSLCQKLISKYNLIVFDKNEIETIMFANTCNTIIMSGGTFSWLLGFFAFYSEFIFYPIKKENIFYGDIFVIPTWIGVLD